MILGGCAQATRHSNLMVFGTNTSFGITAGKDIDTPAISVGYKRQELVLMPLVANTTVQGNLLNPCDVGAHPDRAEHPCVLAATRGEGDNKVARDSYSVLASFGASFDGGVDTGTAPRVKGGLAQYFATGMAAQLLALSGGAAVVATGPAATTSAAAKPDAGAVAAVVGDAPLAAALASKSIAETAARNAAISQNAAGLAGHYLASVPDNEFATEVGILDASAGLDGNLILACKLGKDKCLADLPTIFAGRDPGKISQAVLTRAQVRGTQQ